MSLAPFVPSCERLHLNPHIHTCTCVRASHACQRVRLTLSWHLGMTTTELQVEISVEFCVLIALIALTGRTQHSSCSA